MHQLVLGDGDWLVVKNYTTYVSLAAPEAAGFDGRVVWGSGNQVGTRLAALAVEQSEDGGDGPGVIRYFGDIDAGGFRVPARRWAGQGNSGSGRSCPPGACTTLPSTVGPPALSLEGEPR